MQSVNYYYKKLFIIFIIIIIIIQPRPQDFSLKKWVGREKALASAGHVHSLNILEKLIYMQPAGFALTEVERIFKGKALGTRLIIIIIVCLIFNFYIPFLTSVEEVDEEDEGRREMPLERESFPEYEGKQRK